MSLCRGATGGAQDRPSVGRGAQLLSTRRPDVGTRAAALAVTLLGVACGGSSPQPVPDSAASGTETESAATDPTANSTSTTGLADTRSAGSGTGTGTGTGTTTDTDIAPCTEVFWYRDLDGDGAGDPRTLRLECTQPDGYVGRPDDCDDSDPNNAEPFDELCDGHDNDCDGLVDEVSALNPSCRGCTLLSNGPAAYALCDAPMTFEAARDHCASFGGDLSKIETGAEVLFIDEALERSPTAYRIGLHDRDNEGDYRWVDGTPVVFSNYAPGEPNDAGGDEDCTSRIPGSGLWNDTACDARAFLCRATAPP